MNTTKLISALAFATIGLGAASAVFAQEATSDAWMQAPSVASRAEVVGSLMKARADGSIRYARAGFIESMPVSRSREAVRTETMAARASGELSAMNAEAYAFGATRVAPVVLARGAR